MTTNTLHDWLRNNPDLAELNSDLYGPLPDDTPGDVGALMEVAGQLAPHASEHEAQVAVFQWAAANVERWPELALLYAIPNGGARHRAVAAKLKAEGVKAGVPDMALPVARGPYHSAFLELKHGRNKPTSAQLEWLDALGNQGHFCAVCYTAREAERLLEWYLGLEAT